MFENIIKNGGIDVKLSTDYFKVKDELPAHKLLIFTGPIDAYYSSLGWEKLEYRSINFEVFLLDSLLPSYDFDTTFGYFRLSTWNLKVDITKLM